MKYAGIIYNDFAAAPGVSLSFYTQGCHFHCLGCHNPQTWDFEGGREFTQDTLKSIIKGLRANGIKRSLAIQGGEPLCPENLFLTDLIITTVKEKYPDTEIYLWTGYTYEDLKNNGNTHLQHILSEIDVLIDGPFILAQRDITLPLRGSRNQRVWDMRTDRVSGPPQSSLTQDK